MSKFVPFVLHEHHADKAGLHYDLRLRYPYKQKMASWVVRYLPDEKQKRLAIQVEDHPMSWNTFSGTIPKGSYGAGEVKIAQSGKAEIIQWAKTFIVFKVEGKLLNGKFTLTKANSIGPSSWMFSKSK